MKLLILGATGGTGRQLVEQALDDGHEVVAYVRTPQKLDIKHKNLDLIQGDLMEREKLAAAMSGVDAVLSGLGPVGNSAERPLTKGMAQIVQVMKEQQVSRLIVSTGAGVSDPNDQPTLADKLIKFVLKLVSKEGLADSDGMIEVVRRSGLDWTVARGPRLLDKPGTGAVKVGYLGEGVSTQLTRSDFAMFMLDQLQSNQWRHKAPVVSN